jgi:hypothetical protein
MKITGNILVGMSLAIAVASFTLCTYCFVQIRVTKVPTEQAVSNIERDPEINGLLSAAGAKSMEWRLSWIRSNETHTNRKHATLWGAGVYGFAGLGAANVLLAMLIRRSTRKVPTT